MCLKRFLLRHVDLFSFFQKYITTIIIIIILFIYLFIFSFNFFAEDPDLEGKLTKEETSAIILALSITIVLVSFIALFLCRGNRRLKKARAVDLAERSRARKGHHGARVCTNSCEMRTFLKFKHCSDTISLNNRQEYCTLIDHSNIVQNSS